MDAKSKAQFINSVAAGKNVVCPKCGTVNLLENKFCIACGAEIAVSFNRTSKASAVPVVSVKENKAPMDVAHYEEPNSVFAQGLPEWSVEPPQIRVRRH